MTQSPSVPPPDTLATRITQQAALLRTAIGEREQRTDSGGVEHDHGLHVFISRLLAMVDEHVVSGQPPAPAAVAELVLDAEPLREALALREDDTTRRRDTDWELHSLAYQLLTSVDLLSTHHPELDTLVDQALRERQRAHPFSESVAEVLGSWPAPQRARLAGELARRGEELPPEVAAALQSGTDA
ncbi:hypothetical protein [Streptomyces ipomoeae]|uniref:hypothetical protein n=1 Tax=Streptomyces ipomoeae TaxID=103232 RepID=UPI001146EF40|nr:hypothetical protein [Streptomyces ipomoeae]TQE33094.1 hypothetical protein Sipo7851_21570 [Streptomyces ipomoeae]